MDAKKDALIGQDIETRLKAEGTTVSAVFIQTLKNSPDARDKALYASLVQNYTLVEGESGNIELRVKESETLNKQLDQYEAAYLQKLAQLHTWMKPDSVTVEGPTKRLVFSASIMPITIETKGKGWTINGEPTLTFGDVERALQATLVLSNALKKIGLGELRDPENLEKAFYSSENAVLFDANNALNPSLGIVSSEAYASALATYLSKIYRRRYMPVESTELQPEKTALTAELLDGGFTGTGTFAKYTGSWENGRPRKVTMAVENGSPLDLSFDENGNTIVFYNGNAWITAWNPTNHMIGDWVEAKPDNPAVLKMMEGFLTSKNLEGPAAVLTALRSLKGNPQGSSANLAPKLSSQSGYSLSATVQYDGRIQVILSGNPSASSQEKALWKVYTNAIENSLKGENPVARDLNGTTRQKMGGSRVIEFGERRVEGALKGFIEKNSLPSVSALQLKAQEFAASETAKGDYSFTVYGNYHVSIAQRGKETLVYLSGTPDPDQTDRALWDQYREQVKAGFNTFPGYTFKDEEGLASHGITSIRIPANSTAPAAAEPAPAAPAATPAGDAPRVASNGATPRAETAPSAPSIGSEAEFISSLRGEGWKRLTTLQDNGDSGKILVNIPTDKTSPDYLYSRVHHFLGKDEAVKELRNPENYDVTINGQKAEWRATDKYKDGTWVNPNTGNRVLVEGGRTTIEWKKKAAPSVAAAEPARTVAEAPKALTPEEIESTVAELRTEYANLKARDEALQQEKKPNQLAIIFAPKKEAARLAAVDQKIALLGSDYLDYQSKLAKLEPQLKSDAVAMAFVESVKIFADERIAVLVPTEKNPDATGSGVADGETPAESESPAATDAATVEGTPTDVMAGDNKGTDSAA